jgi:hypothetical protein
MMTPKILILVGHAGGRIAMGGRLGLMREREEEVEATRGRCPVYGNNHVNKIDVK